MRSKPDAVCECRCGKFPELPRPISSDLPGLKFSPMVDEPDVDAEGRRTLFRHSELACHVVWIDGMGWRAGRKDSEWTRPWLAKCSRSESMTVAEMARWYGEVQ